MSPRLGLVALGSLGGGGGLSTLAVNLACSLQSRVRPRSCLLLEPWEITSGATHLLGCPWSERPPPGAPAHATSYGVQVATYSREAPGDLRRFAPGHGMVVVDTGILSLQALEHRMSWADLLVILLPQDLTDPLTLERVLGHAGSMPLLMAHPEGASLPREAVSLPIPFSPEVEECHRSSAPALVRYPGSAFSRAVRRLGGRMLEVRQSLLPGARTSLPPEARDRLRRTILEEVREHQSLHLSRQSLAPSHPDIRASVRAQASRLLERLAPDLPRKEASSLTLEVLDQALGLGPLEPLLADPAISEIMVNGPQTIFLEREGEIQATEARFASERDLLAVVERIVAPLGRRVDESSPMVDGRLPDGSRVHVILPPLALNGAIVTIRRFPETPLAEADLVRSGSMTPTQADWLRAAVEQRQGILISGGTGTGKTTLLNVLSSYIPDRERVITIEEAAELRLQKPHTIRLEARPPNIEGKGEVSVRELVRNALRMRPDRIVVGECRGAEALDMLQAMNTGHPGSLTTIHANTPRDALLRLETLVLFSGMELPLTAVRRQIAAAIRVILQMERVPGSRVRRISSIQEIQEVQEGSILLQGVEP